MRDSEADACGTWSCRSFRPSPHLRHAAVSQQPRPGLSPSSTHPGSTLPSREPPLGLAATQDLSVPWARPPFHVPPAWGLCAGPGFCRPCSHPVSVRSPAHNLGTGAPCPAALGPACSKLASLPHAPVRHHPAPPCVVTVSSPPWASVPQDRTCPRSPRTAPGSSQHPVYTRDRWVQRPGGGVKEEAGASGQDPGSCFVLAEGLVPLVQRLHLLLCPPSVSQARAPRSTLSAPAFELNCWAAARPTAAAGAGAGLTFETCAPRKVSRSCRSRDGTHVQNSCSPESQLQLQEQGRDSRSEPMLPGKSAAG